MKEPSIHTECNGAFPSLLASRCPCTSYPDRCVICKMWIKLNALRYFDSTDCFSDSNFDAKIPGPPVNLTLGQHQSRAYPSWSHPGFGPELRHMGGVCCHYTAQLFPVDVKYWVKFVHVPSSITANNARQLRRSHDYCQLTPVECLPTSRVSLAGMGYCLIWPATSSIFSQLLASCVWDWWGICTTDEHQWVSGDSRTLGWPKDVLFVRWGWDLKGG